MSELSATQLKRLEELEAIEKRREQCDKKCGTYCFYPILAALLAFSVYMAIYHPSLQQQVINAEAELDRIERLSDWAFFEARYYDVCGHTTIPFLPYPQGYYGCNELVQNATMRTLLDEHRDGVATLLGAIYRFARSEGIHIDQVWQRLLDGGSDQWVASGVKWAVRDYWGVFYYARHVDLVLL